MSIEQQRNEEYFEKKEAKKNLEARDQFLLEKRIMRESSDLLKKLASEIANEFWIDISKARELIENSAWNSLNNLKNTISLSPEINTELLKKAIINAQWSIEDLSKKHRESLKKSLEKEQYTPEQHEYYTTETLFPPRIIARAKYPQNIWDQFVGLGLGLIDSSEAVILFTYSLWKGILFTPYHLYLLLTGQAEYQGFDRI